MPQVFVLGGKDVGRSFEVGPGTVLGRSPECGVHLADLSVSRRHARVEREGERWVLVDLGSRNGLRLGSVRVERIELEDHLEVLVGELPLRFRLEPAGTPARAPVPPPDPPTSARPPAAAPADGGIELEEEIDLAAAASARARRGPAPAAEAAAPPRVSERDLRRTVFLRESSRSSFLTSDLGQRPVWVQALVALLVLAFAAGVFFAAFRLVTFLRAT